MPASFRSAILAVCLGLAGCVAHRPSSAGIAPSAEPSKGLGYATIVAVRPANRWEPHILAAIGLSTTGLPDSSGDVEFIVRTDAGATLSVVQPNAENLRPGERVAIRGGAHPRLVRIVDRQKPSGT